MGKIFSLSMNRPEITRKNPPSGDLRERGEPGAVVNMIGAFGGIGKGQRVKGRATSEAEKSFQNQISEVILNQPGEFRWAKNHPPFSKGGQGGLNKRLIIPLNPPLGKGDVKTTITNPLLVLNAVPTEDGF
jgi:hypothetical protein